MNLTRDQLAKLVNDHVQGFRHCTGSLDLADIILKADRDIHRERFTEPPVESLTPEQAADALTQQLQEWAPKWPETFADKAKLILGGTPDNLRKIFENGPGQP